MKTKTHDRLVYPVTVVGVGIGAWVAVALLAHVVLRAIIYRQN